MTRGITHAESTIQMEDVMSFHVERVIQLTGDDVIGLQRVYAEYDIRTEVTAHDLRCAAATNAIFVVRDEDNVIVGFLTLVMYLRMKGRVAQVEDVAVLSTHRRRGAGRMLMRTAIDHARAARCVDVHLSTYPDMEAAAGLYRSIGGGYREMHVYKWKLE